MTSDAPLSPSASVMDLRRHTTPLFDGDAAVRVVVTDRSDQLLGVQELRPPTPTLGAYQTLPSPPKSHLLLSYVCRADDPFRTAVPTADYGYLVGGGTPARLPNDPGLSVFEANIELMTRAVLASWAAASATAGTVPAPLPETDAPALPRSEAFRAFDQLRGWLNLSGEEAADLIGVGRTTPFAWERDGREPQPRTARRLYETHAFVRQLVEVLGQDDARRRITRSGEGSPLALIRAGRVAEAEAEFAHLIYVRPSHDTTPLGAVGADDADLAAAVEAFPERLAGGRRRVNVRRGR